MPRTDIPPTIYALHELGALGCWLLTGEAFIDEAKAKARADELSSDEDDTTISYEKLTIMDARVVLSSDDLALLSGKAIR